MPIWEVREEIVDDAPTGDVKIFNEGGMPNQTLKSVTPGTDPLWGPSLGTELIAAGVTESLVWDHLTFRFDNDVIQPGTERNTLIAVLTAHDPTTPKPPDPWLEALAQFETDANALLAQPTITDAEARALLIPFLDALP